MPSCMFLSVYGKGDMPGGVFKYSWVSELASDTSVETKLAVVVGAGGRDLLRG